mmetsp:Transcript_9699/g.17633  ORF Transcript_9699/g.17633 Transcript_9699/m.17633 type:complete len:201 (-) Transcript_9699:500-1102(-)
MKRSWLVTDRAAPGVLWWNSPHCVDVRAQVEALEVIALDAPHGRLDAHEGSHAGQLHHGRLDAAQSVVLRHPVRSMGCYPRVDPLKVQQLALLPRSLKKLDLFANVRIRAHRRRQTEPNGPLLRLFGVDGNTHLERLVHLHRVAHRPICEIAGPRSLKFIVIGFFQKHALLADEQRHSSGPAVSQLVAPVGRIYPKASHL